MLRKEPLKLFQDGAWIAADADFVRKMLTGALECTEKEVPRGSRWLPNSRSTILLRPEGSS